MNDKTKEEIYEVLREGWCDDNAPSLDDALSKICAIVEAEQSQKPSPSLDEAIKIMTDARSHGGPVAYHDAEDSVGYYACCGKVSYEDHDKDCWYRKMCEFLDAPRHSTPASVDKAGCKNCGNGEFVDHLGPAIKCGKGRGIGSVNNPPCPDHRPASVDKGLVEISKWVAENFDKVRDADTDYRKGMATAYNAVYLKLDEIVSRHLRPAPPPRATGRKEERNMAKCSHAKLDMGYVEASLYADKQMRKGVKQTQCHKCKLWLWPVEWRKPSPAITDKEAK